jgi:DNA polymerase-3 subunit delta
VSETPPTIYLLDGEDEYAFAEFTSKLASKLGDPITAEMNTTRLDGNSTSLEQFESAARSMPFLAPRRLVIFYRPTTRLNSSTLRERFIRLLNELPASAAVVLIEPRSLTSEKERRDGKVHWLERWAVEAGNRVYFRHCALPTGEAMVRWIQERAKATATQAGQNNPAGSAFTPQAASTLADLVGDEPRLADQEIAKLLAYVNYARPVETEDVLSLTPLSARVGDFALVNALRAHDQRLAQSLLHRMLEEGDPILLFHSIVSQYRTLLLAREVKEEGGAANDVARLLKIKSYPAQLALENARRYTLPELEAIYHRLLDLDVGIKTGQVTPDLALEMLVIELTQ